MDMTPGTPVAFRSSMSLQQCFNRLKGLSDSYPHPSFLSRKERSFETVDIRSRENYFLLEKRKTYMNLWAPQLELHLNKGNHTTSIEGLLRETVGWDRIRLFCNVLVAAGFGTLLWSIWNLMMEPLSGTHQLVLGAGTALLAMLLMGFIYVRISCERYYRDLALGEEDFLLAAVKHTLKARQIRQSN